MLQSGHTRIGNYLWVFGGYEITKDPTYQSADSYSRKVFKRTLLWHIERKIWIWGPWMSQKFNFFEQNTGSKGLTGIAINQTIGMLVFPTFSAFDCLAYMTYDFQAFDWTDDNYCFFKLDKYLYWYGEAITKSASSFDKNGDMYEFFKQTGEF